MAEDVYNSTRLSRPLDKITIYTQSLPTGNILSLFNQPNPATTDKTIIQTAFQKSFYVIAEGVHNAHTSFPLANTTRIIQFACHSDHHPSSVNQSNPMPTYRKNNNTNSNQIQHDKQNAYDVTHERQHHPINKQHPIH